MLIHCNMPLCFRDTEPSQVRWLLKVLQYSKATINTFTFFSADNVKLVCTVSCTLSDLMVHLALLGITAIIGIIAKYQRPCLTYGGDVCEVLVPLLSVDQVVLAFFVFASFQDWTHRQTQQFQAMSLPVTWEGWGGTTPNDVVSVGFTGQQFLSTYLHMSWIGTMLQFPGRKLPSYPRTRYLTWITMVNRISSCVQWMDTMRTCKSCVSCSG